MIRQLDERTFVSGQIAPDEVVGLAEQGIRILINNRPDREEGGQPLASEIEAAAADAGIAYHFVPIIRGIGPADIDAMQQAFGHQDSGKILAFCRSGARSALVCALVHRDLGASRERVERSLIEAGFDPAPIDHLL